MTHTQEAAPDAPLKTPASGFFEVLMAARATHPQARRAKMGVADVERALAKAGRCQPLTADDFLALLSEAARPRLEEMARLAQAATLRHFGRAVQLFTPLYLANICTNRCRYCGFNTANHIPRKKLGPDDIRAEGAAIAATGLRHILLLTGDAPRATGVAYIAEAARLLRRWFPGIGVEVYALTEDEYRTLRAAGVDAMTMFQETYNPELYASLHPAGPKRDFRFRLEAPERAAAAGMRSVNIGALLGLDAWPDDAFYTGLHAKWLMETFPGAEVAVSVPRMRPHVGVFDEVQPVDDRDLVQIILATRLFLPTAGITVSTRERPGFRDQLIGLGVTKISAGVSTAVGGHVGHGQAHDGPDGPDTAAAPGHANPAQPGPDQAPPLPAASADTSQFDIADARSVEDISAMLRARGYQPLFKYWQPLDGEDFRLEAS